MSNFMRWLALISPSDDHRPTNLSTDGVSGVCKDEDVVTEGLDDVVTEGLEGIEANPAAMRRTTPKIIAIKRSQRLEMVAATSAPNSLKLPPRNPIKIRTPPRTSNPSDMLP